MLQVEEEVLPTKHLSKPRLKVYYSLDPKISRQARTNDETIDQMAGVRGGERLIGGNFATEGRRSDD